MDLGDDENDVEAMPAPTEDDDDVFESEPSDSNGAENGSNKRRTQSLSSLPNTMREAGLLKVNCFVFFNFNVTPRSLKCAPTKIRTLLF